MEPQSLYAAPSYRIRFYVRFEIKAMNKILPKLAKLNLLFLVVFLLTAQSYGQIGSNVVGEDTSRDQQKQEYQQVVEVLKNSRDDQEIIKLLDKIISSFESEGDYAELNTALLNILKTNSNNDVLFKTASALGKTARDDKEIISALISILEEGSNDQLVSSATLTLAKVGKDSPEARTAVIKVLKTSKNHDVIDSAAIAVGEIGQGVKEAVPELIKILKTTKNDGYRVNALDALAKIRSDATEAIPELIKILKEEKIDKSVLGSTTVALGSMGPEGNGGAPHLIRILNTTTDRDILRVVVIALNNIGAREAVPDLIRLLDATKDDDITLFTIGALNNLGRDNKDLPPALIKIITTKKNHNVLRDALSALGNLKKDAKDAVPILIDILKTHPNDEIKFWVINVLSNIGNEAKNAIPILVEISPRNDSLGTSAVNALNVILDDSLNSNDYSVIQITDESLEKNKLLLSEEKEIFIKTKIDELRLKERGRINSFVSDHPYYSFVFVAALLLLGGWAAVLRFRPGWLVTLHEYLWANTLVEVFTNLVNISTIPVVSLMCLRRRALDAWISDNLEKIKKNFESKETVNERKLYIPVKVSLKGDKDTNCTPGSFREVFGNNQVHLLIHGDGGSGKTSLACQFARWGLDGRLFADHRAVPVFLEQNFENIQTEIKKKIKEMLTDKENLRGALNPISDSLQKELLKTKRILLIVDGISELDEQSKQQIRNRADINALIYTSRNNEVKDIFKIETNNIAPENLYHFISEFLKKTLTAKVKENLFPSDELFGYCERLSKLVGRSGITLFMAKLYAQQMIVQKTGDSSGRLPDSIPALMARSIEDLHSKTPSENLDFSDVMTVSKIIAYESLKQDYRPIAANRRDIEKALENFENTRPVFNHLRRLKLIEIKGIDGNGFAFKIDPLAEYLAASYMVEKNSDSKAKWAALIKDLKLKSVKNNIRGFIVALKDCTLINKNVPESVVEELGLL